MRYNSTQLTSSGQPYSLVKGVGIFLLALLLSAQAWAQDRTVSGKVTSVEDGAGLPGVNVILKGTTVGTVTDIEGNYRLQVPTDAEDPIVQFSFIGYETKEISVDNQSTLNTSLTSDTQSLEEVIVTAQGIEREKKSLGFAVSQVAGEQLEQQSEPDLGRLLSGKASGVNVTNSSGLSGSSTNIVIRGYTSISGSNQPLFVVDGVPFGGDTFGDEGPGGTRNFLDGANESSRFLDLDPNNIADIQVLKGLSATVLYGDRGRNGVILVTTKSGAGGELNKKMEISVNQSLFTSQAILPDYQNNYGGGFHQNFGYFFSNWGPAFDADLSNTRQFLGVEDGVTILQSPLVYIGDRSLVAGLEDIEALPYEYRPYNSVEEFFRTGVVSNTSISARGGGEKTTYSVSYSHVDDKGITPGNELIRDNFNFGGSMELSNRFTIDGSVLFARTDLSSPPIAPSFGSGTGFDGGSAFGDLMYTPRSTDLFGLPFQSVDGRSLYYRSGNDIQNPRWTVNNTKTTSNVTRYFGKLGATFKVTDWLNATYRLGYDTYTDLRTYGQNRGGVDGNVLGLFRTTTLTNRIIDHSILVTGDKELNENMSLRVTLGANARRDEFERDGLESVDQLAFGILRHYNFVNPSSVNSFSDTDIPLLFVENRLGVYGDATFSFRDYLYINASARNDWTSTLEPGNNSILYPGASISFIPTAAISSLSSNPVLNYFKIRAGYGSSAGFPPAYRTRNTLSLNSRGFVSPDGGVISSNTVANRLGNRNLLAERVSEFEVGVEMRLFGRVGFNLSVFDKTTLDLITDQSLDYATGFSSTQVNVGELEVRGLEIDATIDVLETNGGLSWSLNGNFSAIRNNVIELAPGTDRILLTNGVVGEGANYAVEGEPYGVLQGSTILRLRDDDDNLILDANGNEQLVVDDNGNYLEDTQLRTLGDPNPKWTSGFGTTLNYKGFTFDMNWQFRYGGDIYSLTSPALIGRGVADADVPINREALYILPGVTTEGAPNNRAITATNLGFSNYGFGPNEFRIFDGTTLRLNDVTLKYALPASILESTPFGRVTVGVSGFNLWYRSYGFPKSANFDTNSLSTGVGNGLGVDFITGPSVRRFGFNVGITF